MMKELVEFAHAIDDSWETPVGRRYHSECVHCGWYAISGVHSADCVVLKAQRVIRLDDAFTKHTVMQATLGPSAWPVLAVVTNKEDFTVGGSVHADRDSDTRA